VLLCWGEPHQDESTSSLLNADVEPEPVTVARSQNKKNVTKDHTAITAVYRSRKYRDIGCVSMIQKEKLSKLRVVKMQLRGIC